MMGGGDGPFGEIFMGGMFTILKIREGLRSYAEDPGWYDHPEGTVAMPVGKRQAVAPTNTLPQRPHPRPLGGETTFEAVRARSCGHSPGRR
jgi:hypothetical protein